MSSAPVIDEVTSVSNERPRERLLVCLPSLSAEARQAALGALAEALPNERVLIASPEERIDAGGEIEGVGYSSPRGSLSWTLAAADYVAAMSVAAQHEVEEVLVLGQEAIGAVALRALIATLRAGTCDVVLPRFSLRPHEGLVNGAILYPLTRALYADVRFPLAPHAALSRRAVERFGTVAQRLAGGGHADALLWPVAEAAQGGLVLRQAEAGSRVLPHPDDEEFNALFAAVAGSMFADIEAKASFWQRARTFAPAAPRALSQSPEPADDVRAMVESYRLAYANLHELWSLVLPPQTLLALKKLSLAEPAKFAIAPSLWARIVSDFVLGYHVRTINRGHLLGAFTPLYLAWVASFARATDNETGLAATFMEQTAAAFEMEKPYLVARWRWPDRFNP